MVLNDFDQQTITLSPDSLIMDSPLELTQYRIVSWQLVYYDEGLYESENWIRKLDQFVCIFQDQLEITKHQSKGQL